MLRFDARGRFRDGLGPPDPDTSVGGVAHLLGFEGDSLLVVGKWLGTPGASAGPWMLYRLSPDLKVESQLPTACPGVLGAREVFAAGRGNGEWDGRETDDLQCVHAYSLEGAKRASFAACPPGARSSPLQIAELTLQGGDIYWMHVTEPVVRVASVGGEDLGSFGQAPAAFVGQQRAAQLASAAVPGSGADPRAMLEYLTQVKVLVAIGDRLLVAYRRPPAIPEMYWQYGSIVQVFDLRTRSLIDEFGTDLKLVGKDAGGRACWIYSDGLEKQGVRHWMVRTELAVP